RSHIKRSVRLNIHDRDLYHPLLPLLPRRQTAIVAQGGPVHGDRCERRSEMVARANGRMSVPQIFIGSTHVGGYDDLSALDRAGKLDPLLARGALPADSNGRPSA